VRTLLVDADTTLPIELWEGRVAETLRGPLQAHPGVQQVAAAHRGYLPAAFPDSPQSLAAPNDAEDQVFELMGVTPGRVSQIEKPAHAMILDFDDGTVHDLPKTLA